jgi:5-methylthioadenosine/S-adenosylhomocysteine deaminase
MDEAGTILLDGAVAVDDGVIVAVGPRAEIEAAWMADAVVDGTGRVLMPGLVNGHTHAAMVLFRGLADDLPLMTWLEQYIFPMEGRFVDADFVRTGMRLACLEMIQSRTTSFVDMYFHPGDAAEVVASCGLRAVLTAPMIDFPSPGFEGWDDSFAAGVAFAEAWRGRHPRITPGLAPHAPYTVSPEHIRQAVEAAERLGVPLSIHLAEDTSETATIRERYATTPVRHVAGLGVLDASTVAAHVVWLDTLEMDMLAASSAGAIHNPTSNLKTGAGISPVPEMIRRGVKVGLGTDGAASNNDLDLWEEVRLAALLHKGVGDRDPSVMPAATALCLATRCGAEAAGLGDVTGSIEIGKRADLVQVSLESPRLAPLYDVVSHLVYAVDHQDVVTTVVDGQVLMREGVVLTVDGAAAAAEAAGMAARIRDALGDGGAGDGMRADSQAIAGVLPLPEHLRWEHLP